MNKIILAIIISMMIGCHHSIHPYIDEMGQPGYFVECKDIVECSEKFSKICTNGYSHPIFQSMVQGNHGTMNYLYTISCK